MFRKLILVVMAIVASFALIACSNAPAKGYPLDGEVTCMTVENGARFRNAPYVPGEDQSDNIVFEVEMKDHESFVSATTSFNIATPDGVAKQAEFHNGTWYGIRRSDLVAALAGKLAEDIARDGVEDELLWVNNDRATPSGCD